MTNFNFEKRMDVVWTDHGNQSYLFPPLNGDAFTVKMSDILAG